MFSKRVTAAVIIGRVDMYKASAQPLPRTSQVFAKTSLLGTGPCPYPINALDHNHHPIPRPPTPYERFPHPNLSPFRARGDRKAARHEVAVLFRHAIVGREQAFEIRVLGQFSPLVLLLLLG